VSLPGVAELLRPVGPGPASDSGRQASGREAHPQKITVYLSVDEFLDLERARLTLRAHGIGVDRGRLVREAIAVLMMDLEAGIDASVIARRLGAAGRPGPADPAPVPAGGVLANGAHGALTMGVFADDAPANGDPYNGALADVLGNGALTGGALGNGGPVTGVMTDGAPADGGPHNGALANGALTGDALTGGVLGNGGPVTGVMAHGALADRGLVDGAPADGGLAAGGLADGGLVAGAPAGAQ